jgi:hypothetical protein
MLLKTGVKSIILGTEFTKVHIQGIKEQRKD